MYLFGPLSVVLHVLGCSSDLLAGRFEEPELGLEDDEKVWTRVRSKTLRLTLSTNIF